MNFDGKNAGEKRLLKLDDLDKWRTHAHENERLDKERLKRSHNRFIR